MKNCRVMPALRGSEYTRANDHDSGVLVKRTTIVPPDPDFATVVEQLTAGWSHLAGTMARMSIRENPMVSEFTLDDWEETLVLHGKKAAACQNPLKRF